MPDPTRPPPGPSAPSSTPPGPAEPSSASRPARGGAPAPSLWLLGGILTVALVLRLRGLSTWWLNPDEGIYYAILTSDSFGSFWAGVVANAHPPLYYLILRGLGAVTWDFVHLRAFSVACGLVSVVEAWAVARALTESERGPTVAGAIAAGMFALSPGAIELSQVMRPYTLQTALLLGAFYALLRARKSPSRGPLAAYVVLASLAILTHYSSVLAFGVFALIVVADGMERGFDDEEWRRVAAAQIVPAGFVAGLVVLHLTRLSGSVLADEALNGWLSFYMIDSPVDVWLSVMGYHSLLATPWLRGPLALLLVAVPIVAGLRRVRIPAVIVAGGLCAGLLAASLGVYPLGATRHSIWLMVFTVPALGWLGAIVVDLPGRARALCVGSVVGAVAIGGPLGTVLGAEVAPWAPTDQVLREDDLATVVDVIDPEIEPTLVVMSAQTYYLLAPFYTEERQQAVYSQDRTVFHFAYGSRRMLVGEAWDFTAGGDPSSPGHLWSVLRRAEAAFPEIGLDDRSQAVLLVGGWRPALIDELLALDGVVTGERVVPGLIAFLIDLPRLGAAFEVDAAG